MSETRCGIYEIRCRVSNKVYVGSSKSIHQRWARHRNALRNGSHTTPRLQRAWNKHGEDNFVFSVIEECERDKLFEREQFHISRLQPDYNSMLEVRVISKEMRSKMNASMKAIAALRTHCPNGHEYSADNVYMGKKPGDKRCKACNRDRVAAIYANETPEQTAERNRKNKEHHYANLDARRAQQKEYRVRTLEQKRAYDVAYRPIKNAKRNEQYALNREAEAAKRKAYRDANIEQERARANEYRGLHQEKYRAYMKVYNIAYRPIKNAKRRAKAAAERARKATQ